MKNGSATVPRSLALALALLVFGAAGPAAAEGTQDRDEGGYEADPHDDHDTHGGHDGHGEDEHRRRFSVAEFEKFGVVLATAAAGEVDVELELPAEIRPNADRVAHLAPRFAGLVREVRAGVGDRVRKGDVLARIESDNLSMYNLRAGFDGVVIDKHIAPGESVARNHAAFVLADLSTVWIHISVYQKALAQVSVGQTVTIVTTDGNKSAIGTISYVAPVVDQATRTATARVVLDNPDGKWRPGLFVVAHVSLPSRAEVVVTRRALHSFEGRRVVFVKEGDTFVPRPVVVGEVGHRLVGIESGISPGERYADGGSFLVKAELGKGDAGHDH